MNYQELENRILNSVILSSQKKRYFIQNIRIIPNHVLEQLFLILEKEKKNLNKGVEIANKKILKSFYEAKGNIKQKLIQKFKGELERRERTLRKKEKIDYEKLLTNFT